MLRLIIIVAIFKAVLLMQVSRKCKECEINRVLRKALEIRRIEASVLLKRYRQEIDKKAEDFETLEPAILEAVKRPLGDIVEVIAEPSREINWIMAVARDQNIGMNISSMLSTNLARQAGLICPFVDPKDCRKTERYRRVDGKCNNLANPLWGAGFTPNSREVPAHYDSGVVQGVLRNDLTRQTGKNNQPLPSAREVSNLIHSTSQLPIVSRATMSFVFFGQQTAHDIVDTAFENGYQGSFLGCCHAGLQIRKCANIPIPPGDFLAGTEGRTCHPFSRAKEVTDLKCEKGNREQLNMVSSFIDCSNVYGHTNEVMADLRAAEGKLIASIPDHLPFQQHPNFGAFQRGINFLNAGDERVSEQIGLTGMNTIFQREHNRIAEILATYPRYALISDPQERGDAIFFETRKLLIAIKQQITYNEFLRLAVGPDIMAKYDITPLPSGYFTRYDPVVNPSLANVIVVAAARFGHSLLRDILSVLGENYSATNNNLNITEVFWRPYFYLRHEPGFQKGMATDPSMFCDRHIVDGVRNHLFETAHGNGEDLVARNIQRGRDHGVPGYNAYRALVGLSQATEFSTDATNGFPDIPAEVVTELQQIYSSPDDVDVFTGGISEIPVKDGIVGPLFAELLGRQYERLRVGDRYWFENEDNGFTLEQLGEIRKVSMARLVCDNIDGITQIQSNVFETPTTSGSNDRMNCDQIKSIDLALWQ